MGSKLTGPGWSASRLKQTSVLPALGVVQVLLGAPGGQVATERLLPGGVAGCRVKDTPVIRIRHAFWKIPAPRVRFQARSDMQRLALDDANNGPEHAQQAA